MIDPPVGAWRSLTIVNALIGATRRDPNWTDFLYQGGWQVRALEQDIVVPQAAGTRPDAVCPDLVLYRPVNRLVLLLEGKIGTVQAGQLERYRRVDARGVRNKGFANEIDDFQVVYCTTEPHRAGAELALSDTDVPLVVFADDRVYRTCAPLRDVDLEAALAPGLAIAGHVPTRYVPIDIDSTPSELCREIAAQVFAFVVADRRTFTLDDCQWPTGTPQLWPSRTPHPWP